MISKSYTDLYNEYVEKHGGKPKHGFEHFLRVRSKIGHHRTIIRPQIIWWQELKKQTT